MTEIDTCELHDTDLEAAVGGMDCNTGWAVAGIYSITADVLDALGDPLGAAKFRGKSDGVLEGACTK